MSYDEVVQVVCPACGSANYQSESLVGQLGILEHYRCRYCGMYFSQRSAPEQSNDNSLGDAGC